MTPWTRLESEPIWAAARIAHRVRFGRVYHDWGRVLRIYERAGSVLHLPYDRPLDLSILSHTAVLDIGGDRRSRSAAWLRAHAGPDEPVEAARRMILAGPYADLSDPRLPLFELSDLADPVTAERAIADMTEQVRLLTRLSREEVQQGMETELARIRRALRAALPDIEDQAQRGLAERIIEGTAHKIHKNRTSNL